MSLLRALIARNASQLLFGLQQGGRLPWEPPSGVDLGSPLLSLRTGGGGTFTRASEASYFTQPIGAAPFLAWAPPNIIREDKRDGVSGLYLFEPPQTNLCLWSEDLTNAEWIKSGVSIAGGSTTAPDGEVDCKTVQLTASDTARVAQAISGTADATFYVTSFWVRKPSGAGNVRMFYTLRDGTSAVTADKPVGTTWTRIEDLRSWGTGATTPAVALQNAVAGTAQDLEVWGADIKSNLTEGSAFNAPTSYIRTTSAATARAGDDMTWAVTPTAMLSGRFQFRWSPVYATGEASIPSALYTLGTAYSGVDTRTGIGFIAQQKNNVSQVLSQSITFSRNAVMTADVDLAEAFNTVSGAATGNGRGPAGAVVVHAQQVSYCGRYNAATKYYANARIGEPFAVASTAFDFDSVSGRVLDLDARDMATGAVTTWVDRKFGDVLSGTATRNAAINGGASVTFNGTTNIMQLAAWARLNGITALTAFYALVATSSLATEVITELGHTGTNPGSWAFYISSGITVRNYGLGNIGPTQGSVNDTMTPAAVWVAQLDFSLATNEAGIIYKNGVAQSVTNSPNGGNTGALATGTIAVGGRSGGLPWSGSIAKCVIYSGAKTAGEIQSIARAIGALTSISVA